MANYKYDLAHWTTDRLILRNWKEGDRELFRSLNSNRRVMEYFPSILTNKESDQLMDRLTIQIKERGYGFFAAELKENGRIIGFIGLSHPRFETWFTPCVEVGWRLLPEYWGMGLATEGANKCLNSGFEELGFTEIFSFTAVSNVRSQAVMKRIGMRFSAHFDHPLVEQNSDLKRHVLYQKRSV